MNEKNFAEIYRRTTAPFAIDNSGKTDHQKHAMKRITRPRGIGSIEYVISGMGTITENDTTFTVKAGDVFLLHPGEYHDYYPDPDAPWQKLWLQVSGFGVPEILRMYGLSHVNHIPDFDLSEEILNIAQVINPESPLETVDEQGPILMIKLLQKIKGELDSRSSSQGTVSTVARIREVIETSPDANVTLSQLTKEFNVSKQHLIRIFKREYGITPHEYILNHRIALAQSLLKRTSLTMQEISNQLNFCDAAYFSEFFRKHVGISPLDFRKKYK